MGICATCGASTSSGIVHVCAPGGQSIQSGTGVTYYPYGGTLGGVPTGVPITQWQQWYNQTYQVACPKCAKPMTGNTHTCDTSTDEFAKWVENVKLDRQQKIAALILFVPLVLSVFTLIGGVLAVVWGWGGPSMDIGLQTAVTGVIGCSLTIVLKAIVNYWFKRE